MGSAGSAGSTGSAGSAGSAGSTGSTGSTEIDLWNHRLLEKNAYVPIDSE